jgi:hypothetical protein
VFRYAARLPGPVTQLRRLSAAADLVYVNGPRALPPVASAVGRTPVLFHAHSYLPPGGQRRVAREALKRSRTRLVAVSQFVGGWLPPGDTVDHYRDGITGGDG